jgi:hypothetical protein
MILYLYFEVAYSGEEKANVTSIHYVPPASSIGHETTGSQLVKIRTI